MVKEGIRISKEEKKDIVLFLDVQIRKRGRTEEDDRKILVSIDAWTVDAKKKKLVLQISKEGSRAMQPGARLADVEAAVRETVIDTAREVGKEISRLLGDYLQAA